MNTRIRPNVARLTAYTPGEQPDDPQVVKLNTNENPYPPAPAVQEVLRTVQAADLRLYPDPVCRELRTAIAEVHGCTPDHVFCGNGSDEILSLCIRAFCPNRGRIGYFEPSYSLYPVLAAVADVGVAPLPLAEDFTCPPIPPRYDVPVFFWTNPNAPTSMAAPLEDVAALADGSEGVVVLDEAYADFAAAQAEAWAWERPNLLVTRTFSKSYALAGIRLGYALGHPDLIAALFKIKDAYNVDRLTQQIGLAAITDQAYLQSLVSRIKATRARTVEALQQRGYGVALSQTNFLWIKPPADCTAADCFAAWRAQGVLVRYFPGERTGHHLRVTIGTDAQMARFIEVVDLPLPKATTQHAKADNGTGC